MTTEDNHQEDVENFNFLPSHLLKNGFVTNDDIDVMSEIAHLTNDEIKLSLELTKLMLTTVDTSDYSESDVLNAFNNAYYTIHKLHSGSEG